MTQFQIEDYLENKQQRNGISENETGDCRQCQTNVLWRRDKVANHLVNCAKAEPSVKETSQNAKKKRKASSSLSFTPNDTENSQVSSRTQQTKVTSFFPAVSPEFAAGIDSNVNQYIMCI